MVCKLWLCLHPISALNVLLQWRHEQIYDVVRSQLICTDKFIPKDVDLLSLFGRTRVILCTLGTLSNPLLLQKGVFGLVPVTNLVVDEASQVGILDYLVSPALVVMRDPIDRNCLYSTFSESFVIWRKFAFSVIQSSVSLFFFLRLT